MIVHLSQFEGPLDLLLHLISKAKIDIKDIFVSHITRQYMESIKDLSEIDMSTATEFLSMAAMLLEIKSKALLPKPPKQDDEPTEEMLINRLYEYKRFKHVSELMKSLEAVALKSYTKLPEELVLPPQPFELTGVTADDLQIAMLGALTRSHDTADEPGDAAPLREIRRDVYTVSECAKRISGKLRKGAFYFSELFGDEPGREEVITVFIALLELLKQSRAKVVQRGVLEDLYITPWTT